MNILINAVKIELVKFNTRREAREYARKTGRNTAAVIDAGTDKAIGERWMVKEAGEVVTLIVPEKVMTKVKQLSLKPRNVEVLSTTRLNKNVHDVTVVKKRRKFIQEV